MKFHLKNSLIFQRIFGSILLLFLLEHNTCDKLYAQSHPLDKKFDGYVEKTLKDWQAPGVIISVVKDGKHVFAKGYGTRKYGENLLPDENTFFHIASHSKSFTAASIAILVDEGKLSWDDPVKKYIPEFQFSDSYVTENITIRDILLHRAGLPFLIGSMNNSDYSINDLMRDLKTSNPVTGLRERHSYTNVGYAIAGEIVARVSGMNWNDFVTQRIFKPLSMNSSYANAVSLSKALGDPNEIDNIFLPARKEGEVVTSIDWGESFNSVYAPAGGIITTADNIAKWMIMQLQEGEYNGKRLISVEAIREMHKPQVIVAPLLFGSRELDWAELHNPFGHFITYGLGWFSYDYRDLKIDEHTGLGTNSSSIAVVSEKQLGIAVCTNCVTTNPDVWRDMRMAVALKLKVIDYFFGAPETDWSSIFLQIHKNKMETGE
ncbi:serine hydrolase domain-containing protein [Candidatus Latescibacterota bacterium]